MSATEEKLRDALHALGATVGPSDVPVLDLDAAGKRRRLVPWAASLGVAAVAASVAIVTAVWVDDGTPRTAHRVEALGAPTEGGVSIFLCARTSSNPSCRREDATQAQKNAIFQRLRSIQGVSKVEYESREQAYTRFKERYASNPGFVHSTKPGDIPDAFRVRADARARAVILRDVFGLAGVDRVVVP
ncbi:permease-like cell division protein FtsX [Actinomadura gamaensis]|uniref:Permease-like cell division protein FtsX n=1 Tax=Actinomadura gamaensis TaxID=1763541 RepID=A0ABV9U9H8_9ACTN